MLGIERRKPVAYLAEEGKPLHVGEASEIDVAALALHLHHTVHLIFYLSHIAVGIFIAQYLVERRVFATVRLHAPVLQSAVLDECGDNVGLNLSAVGLSTLTIQQLHLNLHEFTTHLLR